MKHASHRRLHAYRHGFAHWRQHRRHEPHTHRRVRSNTHERAQRRAFFVGMAMLAIGLVVIVGFGIAAAINLNHARAQLTAARNELTLIDEHRSSLLTTSGRSTAQTQLIDARQSALHASSILNDSNSIKLLRHLPVIGAQVSGVESLASDVATAADQGVSLLGKVSEVDRSSTGTSVSLPALGALLSSVNSASHSLILLERPSSGLIGPVASARQTFDARLTSIVNQLDHGGQILSYVTTFLGADGPRTYLLATENNAEMRDQGAVLSVGQIHAADGHLHLDSPSSVEAYPLSSPVPIPIPAGTQAVFGLDQPTKLWQDANDTANFPWTGSVLAAMYLQATGTADDGVVAIDVPALAQLLLLTGPVDVPGISQPVTSENVVNILLFSLYQQYPGGSQVIRHDLSSSVASAIFDKLAHEHVDPAALAHTLANLVAGRHLLVYDAQSNLESTLNAYGASGAIDNNQPGHTFHFALEAASANKLSYYLSTSIHQKIKVASSGSAFVQTTITITNHAPAGQAPSYQLGGQDGKSLPGEFLGAAYLWEPRGSSQVGGTPESGLVVTGGSIDVRAGATQSLAFTSVVPDLARGRTLSVRWVPQPTIRSQRVIIDATSVGTASLGEPARQGSILGKNESFSWEFSPHQ